MFENIYIHIGSHKTGSTSIQEFLNVNSENIAEYGYLYPTELLKWSGTHPIAWHLGVSHPHYDPDADYEVYVKNINASKNQNLILSSEDFEFLNEVGIVALKSLFPAKNYHIICFLRNPYDYFVSDYSQNIKMYESRCILHPAEFYIKNKFLDRLNYTFILDKWSRVFGEASVVIRPYYGGIDVVSEFLDIIHLQENAYQATPARSNVSYSPLATATLRKFNSSELTLAQHSQLKNMLSKNDQKEYYDYSLVSEQFSDIIYNDYLPSIKRFCERYNVDEAFFANKPPKGKKTITNEDVSSFMMKLVVSQLDNQGL